MADSPEREQAEALIERILSRGQVVANAGQPPGWWCLAREPELDALGVAVSRLVERAEKAERERDEAVNDQKVTQRWVEIWTEKWQQANRQACEQRDRAHAAVERERELTRALGQAIHIAGCVDALLAGVEDEETLEECQAAASVWMRDLDKLKAALAGGVSAAGRPPEHVFEEFRRLHGLTDSGGTAAVAEAERVARAFHEAYERLAPEYGYETRLESAVPWESVPLMNKRLMVAVAVEVLNALAAATALQRSHQEVDPVVPEVTAPHPCQRCGSEEWTDVDYSGCSDCREAPEVLPDRGDAAVTYRLLLAWERLKLAVSENWLRLRGVKGQSPEQTP